MSNKPQIARTMRIADIVAAASQVTHLSVDDLRSPKRARPIAHTRQVCFLLASLAGHPYAQIGVFFRRNHSTVLHGACEAQRRYDSDFVAADLTDRIRDTAVENGLFGADVIAARRREEEAAEETRRRDLLARLIAEDEAADPLPLVEDDYADVEDGWEDTEAAWRLAMAAGSARLLEALRAA